MSKSETIVGVVIKSKNLETLSTFMETLAKEAESNIFDTKIKLAKKYKSLFDDGQTKTASAKSMAEACTDFQARTGISISKNKLDDYVVMLDNMVIQDVNPTLLSALALNETQLATIKQAVTDKVVSPKLVASKGKKAVHRSNGEDARNELLDIISKGKKDKKAAPKTPKAAKSEPVDVGTLLNKIANLEFEVSKRNVIIEGKDQIIAAQNTRIQMLESMLNGRGTITIENNQPANRLPASA